MEHVQHINGWLPAAAAGSEHTNHGSTVLAAIPPLDYHHHSLPVPGRTATVRQYAPPGESHSQLAGQRSALTPAAAYLAVDSPALTGNSSSTASHGAATAPALPPPQLPVGFIQTSPWAGAIPTAIDPLLLQRALRSLLPQPAAADPNLPIGPSLAQVRCNVPQVAPAVSRLNSVVFSTSSTTTAAQRHPNSASLPASPIINLTNPDPEEKVCTHCGKVERGQWRKRDRGGPNTKENALCNRCYMWRRNHGGEILPPLVADPPAGLAPVKISRPASSMDSGNNNFPISRNNSLPKRSSDISSSIPSTPQVPGQTSHTSGPVSPSQCRRSASATSPTRRQRVASPDPDYLPRSNNCSPKHARQARPARNGSDDSCGTTVAHAMPGQVQRPRSRLGRAGGSASNKGDKQPDLAGSKRPHSRVTADGDTDTESEIDDVGAAEVLLSLKCATSGMAMYRPSSAIAAAGQYEEPVSPYAGPAPVLDGFPRGPAGLYNCLNMGQDLDGDDAAPVATASIDATQGQASVHTEVTLAAGVGNRSSSRTSNASSPAKRSKGNTNRSTSESAGVVDASATVTYGRVGIDKNAAAQALPVQAPTAQPFASPERAAAVDRALAAAAEGAISEETCRAFAAGLAAKISNAGPGQLDFMAAQRILEHMQQQIAVSPVRMYLLGSMLGLTKEKANQL